MDKRQEWVYNYITPEPRMDKGGHLAPLVIPGVEHLHCKRCDSEISLLRTKSRFKDRTHKMLRTFSTFYEKSPTECGCGALKIEVSSRGVLTIYTDNSHEVMWTVRSPLGLTITLAHNLDDLPSLDSPPVEEYSTRTYKRAKWEIQMVNHLDMHQFGPLERRVVLPATDSDRAFFLRCYAYTYKICVSEEQYTYLPTGHRVPYSPDLQGLRDYPEHLIANLHLFQVHPLREELEGILDPFHMASLAKPHAKKLRIP